MCTYNLLYFYVGVHKLYHAFTVKPSELEFVNVGFEEGGKLEYPEKNLRNMANGFRFQKINSLLHSRED